jgi:hypothetical protein
MLPGTTPPLVDGKCRAVQVFLSYRRSDVGGYAGRLADALRQRLGEESVFQDVSAIAPGQRFAHAIEAALDDCDAVLAVIGPGWATASTPEGARRLFDPDDYVRLELARALTRDIRVIPVLVGGAALPAPTQLPDDLAALPEHQAVVLHDQTWHQGVDGLVRDLGGQSQSHHSRARRLQVVGATALAGLVALAGSVWWLLPARNDGTDTDEPLPCAPPVGEEWAPVALSQDPVTEVVVADGRLLFRVRDARWRTHNGTWQVTLQTSMQNNTPGDNYHGAWRYDALLVGRRPWPVSCFSASQELVEPGLIQDATVGFDIGCEPVGYIELDLQEGRINLTDPALEPGPCQPA